MRKVFAAATLIAFMWGGPAGAEEQDVTFNQLTSDVQTYVKEAREGCLNTDGTRFEPHDLMQGIELVDLNGEVFRDLLIDAAFLCNSRTRVPTARIAAAT